MTAEFLERDAVLFLHDLAVSQYGGIPGVKHDGLLMSALARPENKLAYAETGAVDLFDLAAAYAYGLAANHPFNDGNKRTAWSSAVLFLKVNGIDLAVSVEDAVERMVNLASGVLGEQDFAHWLRGQATG